MRFCRSMSSLYPLMFARKNSLIHALTWLWKTTASTAAVSSRKKIKPITPENWSQEPHRTFQHWKSDAQQEVSSLKCVHVQTSADRCFPSALLRSQQTPGWRWCHRPPEPTKLGQTRAAGSPGLGPSALPVNQQREPHVVCSNRHSKVASADCGEIVFFPKLRIEFGAPAEFWSQQENVYEDSWFWRHGYWICGK